MIIKPIYTATVADKRLRFFAGPSGRPELPWHAADDLFVACAFNGPMRQHFTRMQHLIFGVDIRTVATPDGPVVIAPHVAAQALLSAGAQVGNVMPVNIAEEYAIAAAKAMEATLGDVSLDEFVRLLGEAARNSGVAG